MSEDSYIVPGRECGSCIACCRDLAIVEEGFNKLPGKVCDHCTGSGCAIYESRPQLCRTYHCGWRTLPNMDESWRPDRSGILITLDLRAESGEIGGDANLIVVGDASVVEGDRFAGMAAGFIESGTKTFLVLPGAEGMMAYHAYLNDLLGPPIKARNLERVKAMLKDCIAVLSEQAPIPIPPELMGYAPAQATGVTG